MSEQHPGVVALEALRVFADSTLDHDEYVIFIHTLIKLARAGAAAVLYPAWTASAIVIKEAPQARATPVIE